MSDPRVDAYLETLGPEQQRLLGNVRAALTDLVPEAVETISYGMPALRLDGRFLLSYAAWKKHCTIYPIDDGLLARHSRVLDGYTHTKGGLHFTPERPLPAEVLGDLVRGRVSAIRGE